MSRVLGEPILSCRAIDVWYGRVPTLFGVDFDVRAGEIVALLGVNGAGKSTLLKAISGIIGLRAGEIAFEGRRIDGRASHEIVAAGIVQVPGGRGAFAGLTVWENLRLAGATLGRDRRRFATEAERVVEMFPWIAERAKQVAGTLSGGQQQMLLLARAFILRPKLLMIDELSLGLAPVVVEQLLDVVRTVNLEGVSVVVVEQHVDLALSFADRAWFLEKGEVRFAGPALELRDRGDLLRSVFLAGAKEAAL
jgi:ABC-type branched-subunit amino acid transport system ATPase component